MQQDLTGIPLSELVDMLLKDTAHYRMLTKGNADPPQKKVVVDHINLIIAEMKTREGYSEVFNDNYAGTITQD